MSLIDGYCHCGLSKYRPIDQVKRVMDRFGVSRSVLVQHLGEYDNRYIEGIVAAEPERFAGVLLVNVGAEDAADVLTEWAGRRVFRGVRLVARTLAEHPAAWERAAELGLNIVVYDEPTIAAHARPLSKFADRHPGTALVLSHLGMLDQDEVSGYASQRRILEMAGLPNVYVQISGMAMFAKEPYEPLVPTIERLVEAFGPDRLLYGSNFPVIFEDELYGREIDLVRTGKLGVPIDVVEKILHETSMKLWFES